MALSLVGVEAVVENLSSFRSRVGQLNSILDSLRPQATLIQRAFGSLGDGLIGFANLVWDVFSVTLGMLVRDAINAVIGKIQELTTLTFEAGSQFQILELRLERLNFNDIIEGMDKLSGNRAWFRGALGGVDDLWQSLSRLQSTIVMNGDTTERVYRTQLGWMTKVEIEAFKMSVAQERAIAQTQQQLEWIIKLAAQTPYDAEDVANTFTLARAYGFTSDEAKKLTGEILDFSSGMGLTTQQMERIIVNFGQLRSQGKLNMMELRDLARGAFVPINDVLDRMKRNMHLTTAQFDKMRLAGKLTGPAITEFFKAFSEMVGENFTGAAVKMAQTFQAAKANALDLIKGIGGLYVVKPVLDVIGRAISDMVTSFTSSDDDMERLIHAFSRIGGQLSGIVSDILKALAPEGTEGFADGLIGALEGIALWLGSHHSEIVLFFKGIGDTIRNDVIPFITDKLLPAINGFGTWIAEHKDEIIGFFQDIGNTIRDDIIPFLVDKLLPAVGELFKPRGKGGTESPVLSLFTTLGELFASLGGALPTLLPIIEGVFDTIGRFIEWVGKNPDAVESILKVFLALNVLATVGNIFLTALLGLIGALPTLTGLLFGLAAAFPFVITGVVIWFITQLAACWETIRQNVVEGWARIKESLATAWENIKLAIMLKVTSLISSLTASWLEISKSVFTVDWQGLGAAIISGMVRGITSAVGNLISSTVNAVKSAYEAAKRFLQSNSPSQLYGDLGKDQVKGMAQGILGAADIAAKAMAAAVPVYRMKEISAMVSAARPSVSSMSTSTKNYNLTINTGAKSEPIIQDFNMMRSLAMG